jgi:(1->4)-alpha-D-glucan 1-alpha-D-glucosylmutase
VIDADALLDRVAAALARPRSATYRLQLGSALTFDAVTDLADYLVALGVSEAYLSPCFKCGPGSSHGYDVTDHNAFNPEIGSAASFDRMAATLAARGMGVVLDVVPNHMGVAGDSNAWWVDVLENGPSSPYAGFFDIDWSPVKPELHDKVLLPVLPDQYGLVLETQQLALAFSEGAFSIRCGGTHYPVAPDTYALVLRPRLDALGDRLGGDDAHVTELESIMTALDHLPPRTDKDPMRVAERLREKEVIKRRLGALAKESNEVREFIDDNVRLFNGTAGDHASFDLLDELLSAQAYRLADWRVAGEEVNYRRFFDVNHLAAIRMEAPGVFDTTHRLTLALVGEGKVSGLRVDHPDGLYAPGEYLRRLQEQAVLRTARRLVPELTDEGAETLVHAYRARTADAAAPQARPFWVVAEKILSPEEPLPEWWRTAGTTGYDFLASLNGLFVDRSASRQLTAAYSRFVGSTPSMAEHVYAAKRLIMLTSMASEISELGYHLDRISETDRFSRDFTLASLVRALREVIACFPVYRTYVGDETVELSARDRGYIELAVTEAKRRNPTINVSVFDFVRDTLLLRHWARLPERGRDERLHFAMRFQQTTGPVTAKGVEDTAFYLYNRLVSLNEVGGDPARFGESVPAFHDRNGRRRQRWPDSLSATSTHDTKRGEDVRARINVLSEIPAEWQARARRWRTLGRRWRRDVDGRAAPDRNDEYLLYQSLVGAWPAGDWQSALPELTARLRVYMEKATKEAKANTSWINPNPRYDEAVHGFVTAILGPDGPFLQDFRPFQERVARYGMINSLAQVALKIGSPGIPDFYQGTELWDLSLVDPDNRRPVDFAVRRQRLASLGRRIDEGDLPALCDELLESWPDGGVKLYLTHRALTLRRERLALFRDGDYRPLAADGERADHVVAFARRAEGDGVIVVAPRLAAKLTGFDGRLPLGASVWGDTWLALGGAMPGGRYRDRFTGLTMETQPRPDGPALSVGALLGRFPVALLEYEVTP